MFDGDVNRVVKSGTSWPSMLRDAVNMLWNWGLDFVRLETQVNRLLDSFDNIYNLQNEGKYFSTVEDLLDGMTPDGTFKNMLELGAGPYIQEKWGISNATYNQVVAAFSHVNYNQNIEGMNAFVMAVSLAGVQDGLWAVKHGNKLICSGILQKVNAALRHEEVVSVKQASGEDKLLYTVRTDKAEELFDAVVIAAPLKYAGIEVQEYSASGVHEGQYCHTYVTFVCGQPRKTFFGLSDTSPEPFPELVITSTNDSLPINTIGILKTSVDNQPAARENPTWKIFSQKPLTDNTLDELFSERQHVVVWEADAFPLYSDRPKAPFSFVLDAGLFYTSPIEWAASAMEMSALSGRNAALLADAALKRPCGSASKSGLLSNSDPQSCAKEGG